ncbi:MAG: TraB/GumN family protein [Psychrobium sp.]|nr:TraB/GumN family protein [Psychrobium sp.]
MKPLIKALTSTALLLTCFTAASAFAETSLWKVSKNNDYVYLGGTVHILPASQFPLPKEFELAYNDSTSLVLEANMPDPMDQAAQIAMVQKLAYKNGKKLSDVISPETFTKLKQYFSPFGINIDQYNGFKPGMIVTLMVTMEAQKANLAGEGVDAYFAQRAKKDARAMEYLESVDFQLNLFSNMGAGNEDAFIKISLSQMHEFEAIFRKILPAWRSGDIKTLNELVVEPIISEDPKSYQSMFVNRNNNWLPKIEAMFNDKDREFVLVGAGHLVGKDSVINLLKAKGYKVVKL